MANVLVSSFFRWNKLILAPIMPWWELCSVTCSEGCLLFSKRPSSITNVQPPFNFIEEPAKPVKIKYWWENNLCFRSNVFTSLSATSSSLVMRNPTVRCSPLWSSIGWWKLSTSWRRPIWPLALSPTNSITTWRFHEGTTSSFQTGEIDVHQVIPNPGVQLPCGANVRLRWLCLHCGQEPGSDL